jgi:myo-inositol-1(or 4)-monophosphatase
VLHSNALLAVAAGGLDLAHGIVRNAPPGLLSSKGERDVVSDVDLAVERCVREYLHETTPEIGFLGEEEGRGEWGADDQLRALDPTECRRGDSNPGPSA